MPGKIISIPARLCLRAVVLYYVSKKMITRHYYKEAELLVVKYEGTIKLSDILNNIEEVFEKLNLPNQLTILEDGRDAVYNLSVLDNEKIREAMAGHVQKFATIFCAFVQNKPFETAVNLEYEYNMPYPNFHYRVFTTMEAALKWLGKNLM